MIYLLLIYLLCFVIASFFSIKESSSTIETIIIMLFIPFVMIWEIVSPYYYKATGKLAKKRLQKDFGVDTVRQLTDNKEAKFLFVENKVRRFFNIWLYTLFGIKRRVRDKDRFQQPRKVTNI